MPSSASSPKSAVSSVPPSAASSASRPSASGAVPEESRWIVLGDVHDKIARLGEIPGISEADGVLVTGDLTVDGGVRQAKRVLEALRRLNPTVYAQIGNMDRGETNEMLDEEGVNTHRRVREIAPGTALMGLGGSIVTPFRTPSEFTEVLYASWLETMFQWAKTFRRFVLSSHTPPYGTSCDVLRNGAHAGSVAVREFVLKAKPVVCLCGHIHESPALDRLGETLVVNPGAFAAGGWAELRLSGNEASAELRVLGG